MDEFTQKVRQIASQAEHFLRRDRLYRGRLLDRACGAAKGYRIEKGVSRRWRSRRICREGSAHKGTSEGLQEARQGLGIPWEVLERDYLLPWVITSVSGFYAP